MDIDEPQPERGAGSPPDADTAGGHPGASGSGTDGPGAASGSPAGPDLASTALPPKMEAWRRRSAAGAILTGFALGLQQALETHREEPSIVVQTSGDLPDDLPVEADFEYGRPRQSVVSIRPWLLNDSNAGRPGSEPAGGEGGGGERGGAAGQDS